MPRPQPPPRASASHRHSPHAHSRSTVISTIASNSFHRSTPSNNVYPNARAAQPRLPRSRSWICSLDPLVFRNRVTLPCASHTAPNPASPSPLNHLPPLFHHLPRPTPRTHQHLHTRNVDHPNTRLLTVALNPRLQHPPSQSNTVSLPSTHPPHLPTAQEGPHSSQNDSAH